MNMARWSRGYDTSLSRR